MWHIQLLWKDWQTLLPMAVLTIIAETVHLLYYTYNFSTSIPLAAESSFNMWIPLVGIAAAAFGWWTVRTENQAGTWLFLLHRPIPKHQLILSKLINGLVLLLISLSIPLVVYCSYVTQPGLYAAPVFWWYSTSHWLVIAAGTVIYLSAFWSTLRPQSWYIGGCLPLGMGVLFFALTGALPGLPYLLLGTNLVVSILIVLSILQEAEQRDF